jgi:tRNA G18 (ribose-2'-O)-methylase SpoU
MTGMTGAEIAIMLKQQKVLSAAMALSDDSVSITDPILPKAPRLAIFLGNEGNGLPEETIRACDYVVRIPMNKDVDSLNVAAASAVAFWQLRADS